MVGRKQPHRNVWLAQGGGTPRFGRAVAGTAGTGLGGVADRVADRRRGGGWPPICRTSRLYSLRARSDSIQARLSCFEGTAVGWGRRSFFINIPTLPCAGWIVGLSVIRLSCPV